MYWCHFICAMHLLCVLLFISMKKRVLCELLLSILLGCCPRNFLSIWSVSLRHSWQRKFWFCRCIRWSSMCLAHQAFQLKQNHLSISQNTPTHPLSQRICPIENCWNLVGKSSGTWGLFTPNACATGAGKRFGVNTLCVNSLWCEQGLVWMGLGAFLFCFCFFCQDGTKSVASKLLSWGLDATREAGNKPQNGTWRHLFASRRALLPSVDEAWRNRIPLCFLSLFSCFQVKEHSARKKSMN